MSHTGPILCILVSSLKVRFIHLCLFLLFSQTLEFHRAWSLHFFSPSVLTLRWSHTVMALNIIHTVLHASFLFKPSTLTSLLIYPYPIHQKILLVLSLKSISNPVSAQHLYHYLPNLWIGHPISRSVLTSCFHPTLPPSSPFFLPSVLRAAFSGILWKCRSVSCLPPGQNPLVASHNTQNKIYTSSHGLHSLARSGPCPLLWPHFLPYSLLLTCFNHKGSCSLNVPSVLSPQAFTPPLPSARCSSSR